MPIEALMASAGKWLVGKASGLAWSRGRKSAAAQWRTSLTVSDDDSMKREPWTLASPVALSAEDLAAMSHIHMGEVRGWLQSNKQAFDHGETVTRLRLKSEALEPIEIVGAKAVVERRVRDRLGALVHQPTAGAHCIECMGLDLSAIDPQAVYVVEDGLCEWTTTPFFERCQITLMPGEHTDVNLRSRTVDDTVTWRLELTVRIGNRSRLVPVMYPDMARPPLRTSAVDDCEQRWITGLGGPGAPPWLRSVSIDEWTGQGGVSWN